MRLTLGRAGEFISASGDFPHEAHIEGYSIDSRTVQRGELFFAVKGERPQSFFFLCSASVKFRDFYLPRLLRWLVHTANLAPTTPLHVPASLCDSENTS